MTNCIPFDPDALRAVPIKEGPPGQKGTKGDKGDRGETGAGAEDPGDLVLLFENKLS